MRVVLVSLMHSSRQRAVSSARRLLGSMSLRMLLMAYFPDKLIDRLLAGMKAKGMAIPRKAVLTPTNAGWNSAQLFAELSREAARFKP